MFPARGDRRTVYVTGCDQSVERHDVHPRRVREVALDALDRTREFAAAADIVWATALADGEQIRAAALAVNAEYPDALAGIAAQRPCGARVLLGRRPVRPGSPPAVTGPAVVTFRARDGREKHTDLARSYLRKRLAAARVPVLYLNVARAVRRV